MSERASVIYPFHNLQEEGWGNSLRASLLIRYLSEIASSVETLSVGQRATAERRGNVRHIGVAAPAWRTSMERWRLRLTRLGAGRDAAFATSVEARFDEPRTLTGFDAALRAVVANSDVAFVEYPFWMPYVAPVCRDAGIPVVLTLHDIHAQAHQAQPIVAERIARRELDATRLADAVFCVSAEDRAYLAAHGIDAALAINPIARDACRSASPEATLALRERYGLGTGPLCMFVGSRVVPNFEAAAALERIAPQLPDCTFVIAGRCVTRGRHANVVRLGFLDGAELEALYSAADAVVLPLSSGTGTSLKFVEALAYGKAIVATATGARGYEAESGVHAHVVPDVASVPAGLRRVLDDAMYRITLEAGARMLATRYDFHTVFEPYGAWLRRGRTHLTAGAM